MQTQNPRKVLFNTQGEWLRWLRTLPGCFSLLAFFLCLPLLVVAVPWLPEQRKRIRARLLREAFLLRGGTSKKNLGASRARLPRTRARQDRSWRRGRAASHRLGSSAASSGATSRRRRLFFFFLFPRRRFWNCPWQRCYRVSPAELSDRVALQMGLFAKLFGGKKEMRILMVGLDAAGKTTILCKWSLWCRTALLTRLCRQAQAGRGGDDDPDDRLQRGDCAVQED